MNVENCDVFIVCPRLHAALADALRAALAELGRAAHVVDAGRAGESPDEATAEALNASGITAVLMGPDDPPREFDTALMARAVAISRDGDHRLVPIHLPGPRPTRDLPYGLGRLRGVPWQSAGQLAALLDATLAGAAPAPPSPGPAAEQLAGAVRRRRNADEASAALDLEIRTLKQTLRASGHLHPSDILGHRYQLEVLLGEGGYGAVWRANTLDVDSEQVAVKVLHPSPAAAARDRFYRGARAMKEEMRMPGVVPILDGPAECEGWHYFAMPYLPERDLHRALKSGAADRERALRALFDVADTLEAVHERGGAHRDVKPHNVLLDGDDAYLSDFDLVHRADVDADAFLGTPLYSAPELAEDADAGPAADQYGLAMSFACALHGKPLPSGHLRRDWVGFFRTFDEAVRPVLLKALSTHPERRYPSVGAFAEALRAVL